MIKFHMFALGELNIDRGIETESVRLFLVAFSFLECQCWFQ